MCLVNPLPLERGFGEMARVAIIGSDLGLALQPLANGGRFPPGLVLLTPRREGATLQPIGSK
jgi:hypothetical protein